MFSKFTIVDKGRLLCLEEDQRNMKLSLFHELVVFCLYVAFLKVRRGRILFVVYHWTDFNVLAE